MSMRTWLATLTLALVLAAAPRAWAATGNKQLDDAMALYDDLEYAKAAPALEAALAQPGLTVDEQVAGLRDLALAYIALGRDDDAVAAYKRLLAVAPDFQVPEADGAKAQDLLARARAEAPRPVRVTSVPTPATPRAGQAVTFEVRVDDPGARVASVTVYYRARGAAAYSSVKTSRADGGAYGAQVSGAFVAGPGLEYYVVAVDAAGQSVGGEGSAATPLSLAVGAARAGGKKKPIYATWWFWTGVGGVVAGGIVAAILLSGSSSPSDQVNVTVTVH
jgi:tetratricopeptide (TPR) repeat protein